MRWHQSFMAEVSQALQQLGLRACPVCGSAASLGMSPFPVVLVAWLPQLHARIVMRIWPVNCENRTNSGTRRVYLGARVPAGQRRSRSVR